MLALGLRNPIQELVVPGLRVLERERGLDRLTNRIEDHREVLVLGDVDADDPGGLVDLQLFFQLLVCLPLCCNLFHGGLLLHLVSFWTNN